MLSLKSCLYSQYEILIPGSRGNHWDTKLFHWNANQDRELTEGEGCKVGGADVPPACHCFFLRKLQVWGCSCSVIGKSERHQIGAGHRKTWARTAQTALLYKFSTSVLSSEHPNVHQCWSTFLRHTSVINARKKTKKKRGKPKNIKNIKP